MACWMQWLGLLMTSHITRHLPLLMLPTWALSLVACGHSPDRDGRWIDEIVIKGNSALSDGDLTEGLATEETGWWPFAEKKWLDRTALEIDLRRIIRKYADRGYYGARILNHSVKEEGERKAQLIIELEEGPPTRIKQVEVAGLDQQIRQEIKLDRLLARHDLEKGEIVDYDEYERLKAAVRRRLDLAGYAYSELEGEILVDRNDQQAMLVLEVSPGPQVRLQGISIEGEEDIPERAIRQRMTWEPGERYHPQLLTRMVRRLNELNVFSTVMIKLPEEPQQEVQVQVQVAPSKLHRLRLGGGIGIESRRHEARLLMDWSLRNFLGGMRNLTIGLKPAYVAVPTAWGSERHGFAGETQAELTQPDLFKTLITATALLGYDLGFQEGYRYHGPRLRFGLIRPFFYDRLRLGLSWNLRYLNFFDIVQDAFDPSLTPLGLGFQDPYRLAWLEQFIRVDFRDQPLDPRKGFYAELVLEEGFSAIGGAFSYFKLTPDVRGYLPLGNRVVIAARALFGWLAHESPVDSPITQRYLLGGPVSHRGFSYGRLSPQVIEQSSGRRIPLGGNGALLFSGEVRIRMFQLAGFWLNIIPFADAGDVTPKLDQLDLGMLHLAVGGSLGYETPIGSIRAGVGVRLNRLSEVADNGLPNPDPGERIAFHIILGTAF